MSWRDNIDVSELPEIYRTIADAIGPAAMILLAERCQKMHLYLKRLPAEIDPGNLSKITASSAALSAGIIVSSWLRR